MSNWGGLGNCVFVLITGYFTWNSHFKLQKIVRLWLEIFIYSIGCGMICFLLGQEQLTLSSVMKMFMPVTFNEYWYMSTYILLYLLIPYINKIIENLNKEQYIFLISLFLIFFSILPTFACVRWMVGAGNLFVFIGLYSTGAFVSKYNIDGVGHGKLNYIGFVIGIIGVWMSEIILKILGVNPFYFSWEMYKTPVILMAVFMFFIFKNYQVNLPIFVLTAAESVGGVYLFHIGRLNKIIFLKIFNNDIVYEKSIVMIIHIVAAVFLIFIAGVLINKIVNKFIEVIMSRFIKTPLKRADEYIKKYIPE